MSFLTVTAFSTAPSALYGISERGLNEFDLVDITSISRDGRRRTAYGYRAVRYDIPPKCAAGYMPELNILCGIADVSEQSEQPVTKHLVVEAAAASTAS